MVLIALLLFAGLLLAFAWFQYKQVAYLTGLIEQLLHPQMTYTKPEKNQFNEENPNLIDLNEQNIHNIPPNVKFEIEGGDTIAPPDYEVKN